MSMNLTEAIVECHQDKIVFGENGHAEISLQEFDNIMLAFFDKLVRRLPEERIRDYIQNILVQNEKKPNDEACKVVKNLFLLVFQTRNCRGGKGEKRIAFIMLKVLYEYFPNQVIELISLLPRYGTWKDPLSLILVCHENNVVEDHSCKKYEILEDAIWRMYGKQLTLDHEALASSVINGKSPEGISLCSKFTPSENGQHSKKLKADAKIAKYIKTISTHNDFKSRKLYRKINTALRSHLEITEQKMCAQKWSEIDFAKVPSLCFDRNKMNFLNEKTKYDKSEEYMIDRIKCKENLIRDIETKGVEAIKGKQLFIHELVSQAMKEQNETIDKIINIQYQIVKDGIIELVEKRQKVNMHDYDFTNTNSSKKSNLIVMSDVSGSMTMDESILVSIGMGILVSEITNSKYRNKVMTFDTNPSFHIFNEEMSFTEKVKSMMSAPWGMSTDILAAMKLLIDLYLTGKVDKDEIPDIVIVSDMNWDQTIESHEGDGKWDCIYAEIQSLFLHKEIPVPKIIFWNVRSDSVGFSAKSNVEGVTMLSGFSQNLFKYVFSGELEEDVQKLDENGTLATSKRLLTASELFENILLDKELDPVRILLENLFPEKTYVELSLN